MLPAGNVVVGVRFPVMAAGRLPVIPRDVG